MEIVKRYFIFNHLQFRHTQIDNLSEIHSLTELPYSLLVLLNALKHFEEVIKEITYYFLRESPSFTAGIAIITHFHKVARAPNSGT